MYEKEVFQIEHLIDNQNGWLEQCINLIEKAKPKMIVVGKSLFLFPEPVAELIKECIVDKKPVKGEVNRFRAEYQDIKYSYDSVTEKQSEPAKVTKLKN